MSISASQVTRLGISGQIWRPAGSFAGKAASPPVFSGTIPDITGNEGDADIITDLSTYFTGATSYSIAPAVETGWNFDTGTGILTVDTDEANTFGTYVVTGTNATGSDASNAFSVIISESTEANAGGWGSFWVDYELEQYRKDEARKKQKRLEAKAQKIKDELERQIALEQRKLEREELRRAELVKITNLAARAADAIEDMRDNTLKVALTAAVEQQTFSTMERLERELRLLKEEEEFLLMAAEIILNDRRIH